MVGAALTCTILTCPEREARAITLAARLLSLEPSVMVDRTTRQGNLDAAMLAWGMHDDAGHHLVLQDDAVPVPGFTRSVRAAIQAAPDAAIAYWMRPWLPEAQAHTWAPPGTLIPVSTARHWPPTVALSLPARLVPGLLEHAARCHKRDRYDDEVVGCYLEQAGIPLLACSPSIVEHDHTIPSVLNGHRQRHRTRSQSYLATEAPTSWSS